MCSSSNDTWCAAIGYLGGTVLGSTNRGNPCHFPVEQPDGTVLYEDRTDHLVSLFRRPASMR